MKRSTIMLATLLLLWLFRLAAAEGWDSLRVGTEKGATDVMLDGKPTPNYHQYRRIMDEDDVEVTAREDESTFYLSGISLKKEAELSVQVAREMLAKVDSKISEIGDDKSEYKIQLGYDCTQDLTGVTDVFVTLTLDGETCTKFGLRKKCGTQYSYAPIEISETSYWGLKKNVLTDNGGQSNHPENLFDKSGDANVISKSKKSLNFRVKNTSPEGSNNAIMVDSPIARVTNEADNVIYPVLRGPGARPHTLMPQEYTDFKLEFNCISLDTDSESVEITFRLTYHSDYVFRVTKEWEGLTASGLIKKKFQDSFVFDFFALLFLSIIILAILSVLLRMYAAHQEKSGDDSIKNFFKSVSNRVKSGFQFDEEDTQLEMDEVEETHMNADYEFDPDDVLKTNSKKEKNEDDFNAEVQVDFARDDENYPSHELNEMSKDEEQPSSTYGAV